jgi:hypothetical protein
VSFRDVPASAAWRHRDAREGFESLFFQADRSGYRFEGHSVAAEASQVWAVHYVISLDERWITRSARIVGWSEKGEHELSIEGDGTGRWRVDGSAVRELDGCLDVDLESSVCTNTIAVRRLTLAVGQSAPAAYVRAVDLQVERIEQRYTRLEDEDGHQRYAYSSTTFGFEACLVYDDAGLILEYPGIASRSR